MPNSKFTAPRILYLITLSFILVYSGIFSVLYTVGSIYVNFVMPDDAMPVVDNLAYAFTWSGAYMWVSFRLNHVVRETFYQ